MQVILMDKVVNLGNLGDVVKVKDGFARNFLIPTGRARRATQANMEAFAAQKAELERVAAEKLAEAQARAAKLEGFSVTVSQKAGVDGRLFGSITNADIADALKAQGHRRIPGCIGLAPRRGCQHHGSGGRRTISLAAFPKKGAIGSLFHCGRSIYPLMHRFINSLIPWSGRAGSLESCHGRYPLTDCKH